MEGENRAVAFQGEPGAYSEQALHKYLEGRDTCGKGVPCDTLEGVIRGVEKGRVSLGIVPVENSIGGYVDRAYRLIARGKVHVVGEVYLRVRHSLLGMEGTEVSEIETVYSHPQALKQCRGFLSNLGVETHATYDTAGSAKMVAERGEKTIAAIASRLAGKRYGLEVLSQDVQSSSSNYTRFLLVSSEPEEGKDEGVPYKTTVTFQLGDSPGSLYDCLAPFAERGVNLTMIQSRPTDTGRWEYHFDLDMEGSRRDREVKGALEKLRKLVSDVRVLGSYPRGRRE